MLVSCDIVASNSRMEPTSITDFDRTSIGWVGRFWLFADSYRVRTNVVRSRTSLTVIAELDPATRASTAGGGLPDQVHGCPV